MEDHEHPVLRGAHVQLEVAVATVHGAAESGQRVLPGGVRPAVGEGQRPASAGGKGVRQVGRQEGALHASTLTVSRG
ncbi:hypothetical protein ACFFX0_17455 [Citricoccus parietis]|uniref:Uncharacterized protein n=1 Tax=Citricoccus parietis TaxID=592307 RepID=A0ABV5G2K4_9MICC